MVRRERARSPSRSFPKIVGVVNMPGRSGTGSSRSPFDCAVYSVLPVRERARAQRRERAVVHGEALARGARGPAGRRRGSSRSRRGRCRCRRRGSRRPARCGPRTSRGPGSGGRSPRNGCGSAPPADEVVGAVALAVARRRRSGRSCRRRWNLLPVARATALEVRARRCRASRGSGRTTGSPSSCTTTVSIGQSDGCVSSSRPCGTRAARPRRRERAEARRRATTGDAHRRRTGRRAGHRRRESTSLPRRPTPQLARQPPRTTRRAACRRRRCASARPGSRRSRTAPRRASARRSAPRRPGRRGRRRSRARTPRAATCRRARRTWGGARARSRPCAPRRRRRRTCPRRCRRPGGSTRPGTATLAVGNPSSRPRRSPSTTVPRTSCGPAEQRGGAGDVALGEQLADAGRRVDRCRPARGLEPEAEHLEPSSAPICSSSATLPPRPRPKWKSAPTTTSRACAAVDEHLAHELLGRLAAAGLVEVQHEREVEVAGRVEQLELLLERGEQLRAPTRAARPRPGGDRR